MPTAMKPVAVACGDCDWIYLLPEYADLAASALLGIAFARSKVHTRDDRCALNNMRVLYTPGGRRRRRR